MRKLIAIVSALMLIWLQISFPVAMAAIEADACDSGDHVYELVETVPGGYGGRQYFEVEECEYVSYEHQHYYITGEVVYYYVCIHCGNIKEVTVKDIDEEMGAICTVYDPGR